MTTRQLLEMAQELLPKLSHEEDLILLKQLRKLYKKDIEEFSKKLERINIIRKTEGLKPIHPNEIITKSLKTDIKRTFKPEKKEKQKLTKEEKLKNCLLYMPDTEFKVPIRFFVSKEFYSHGKKGIVTFHFMDKYPHPLDDLKEITIEDSPLEYRVIKNEIRFPTIKKKIVVDSFGAHGIDDITYLDTKLRLRIRNL